MKNFSIMLIVLLSWLTQVTLQASNVRIVKLLTEYELQPMGVETQHPRFSWQMSAAEGSAGCRQTACQIQVKDKSGRQLWDSGRMDTSESLNIRYDGERLSPACHYDWTVTVWDEDGQPHEAASWFETGLMAKNEQDAAWGGAQWIGTGDDDQAFYAHYLPVFRLGFTVTFDRHSHSTSASILYGGNDERLMDANKNIYHLQARRDSSFIRIELDGNSITKGGQAKVKVYRKGYHPDDNADRPLTSFDIPQTIIGKHNLYQPHRMEVASNLGDSKIYVDRKEVGNVNLNPLGRGGDFIAYPVVGDVGIRLKQGQKATFTDLSISNLRSPGNVIAQVDCREGLHDPSRHAMPMLRRDFTLDKEVAEARLYVTARGVYDFYVNGQQVNTDYLNPGVTQYNKTHLYQIYDVTAQLRKGGNAMGAVLGEGWWSGGITYEGQNWNYFGDRLSLLAKLSITFKDGSHKDIVSSPEGWTYCAEGPVRYGSLFQGEVYDARKEMAGWTTAGFDTKGWKQTVIIPTEGHISHEGWGNGPAPDDYTDFRLMPQTGQGVRACKRLQAVSVSEPRPGVFIYDMGQNMVGVPDIALSGLPEGTKVSIRYAEVLYPDLPEYQADKGMLMLENIRAAMAQDIYIARGKGTERFSPRFTNHGYRYLEITGIPQALQLGDVGGIVLSSIDKLDSHYTTSNPLVNKLWENISWSTLGNFVSIPTDCPQRNERLGWAGDISVFSRTATYMAQVSQFLRRYLLSMRDVQRADGRMPDIAPLGGGFGSLLWGSASITVPWECYQQYGDKILLQEHYEAMKRYVDYIFAHLMDPATGIIVQNRAWDDLGDWLGLEDEKNDKSLFWEAYLIYDLNIMRKVADILGHREDAERFAKMRQERRDFFIRTYLRPMDYKTISSGFMHEKGSLIDTQTSYVLPLALGVVEGETARRVAENLRLTIERENTMDNGRKAPAYSLLTGFIGTAWISKALSDAGMADVAYRLLQQESYPSWLYPVTQGATTIWERLNSYTHLDGFGGNNRMNSFNHYSFGAVGAWMYNYSIGIQRDELSPGFKHFFLQPMPDPTGKMTSAQGYYDSMYGRIESSWKVEGRQVTYDFTIPTNTSATWRLPDGTARELTSGHYCFQIER